MLSDTTTFSICWAFS